ncbi:non-ribosomal peptide synthetase [Kordia jejudonensis]|uniref:non-ribosomal peptide synthetase n=1 Tax=Kordia jejudonensis TaxID=1348245 RepID=UPI000629B632|nr:non-ribosomal peptide synthetase [Kordia jejudonensis]
MKKNGNIEDVYTLSPLQEGMLFHALHDTEANAYFEQISYRIKAALTIATVKEAVSALFKRHDVLRTSFLDHLEKPVQVVLKNRTPDFFHEKLATSLDKEAIDTKIAAFKIADRKKGFDLKRGSLMRLSMLQIDDTTFEFIWSYHHIIIDGWSMGILIEEFFEIYNALHNNRPTRLTDPQPYKRYISWLTNKDSKVSEDFWKNYLDNITTPSHIPPTQLYASDTGYKNQRNILTFSEEETNQLNYFVKEQQLTLNNFIQTIWGIVVSKYTQQEETIFGMVTSGRPPEIRNIEAMVGLFINTIPVRIKVDKEKTIAALLKEVQTNALLQEAHQYDPLADIQAATPLKNNLFDHILVLENFPIADQLEAFSNADKAEEKLDCTIENIDVFEQTNYNLSLLIQPTKKLIIDFLFNGNVHDSAFIKLIANDFKRLILQAIKNTAQTVDTLFQLSEAEVQQLAQFQSHPKQQTLPKQSLISAFAKNVQHTPNRTALYFEGNSMTYQQLEEASNTVANYLLHQGVQQGDIVGIIDDRTAMSIVSIWGILKAGGAYVILDSSYPVGRIEYMLADSKPTCTLIATENPLRQTLNHKQLISYEDAFTTSFEKVTLPTIKAEDAAYIIYTSGSTGVPKGIKVSHENVLYLVDSLFESVYAHYPTSEALKIALLASFSFDPSVQQLFGCFVLGHSLYLVPEETRRDGYQLMEYFTTHEIDITDGTPSHLRIMAEVLDTLPKIPALKHLLIGGEQLDLPALKKIYQWYGANAPRTINLYGPAECTVDSIAFDIHAENIQEMNFAPIGTPMKHAEIYILDAHKNHVPIGAQGEICIAGKGFSKGYINKELAASKRFIQNPFNAAQQLYCSGDFGRWLPDGNIQFIGRNDDQIKIRGFRVEIQEVTAQIAKISGIQSAYVLPWKQTHDYQLCAYIIPEKENYDAHALKAELATLLPSYMIPSFFMKMEKFPMTVNGKIDASKFPNPTENIPAKAIQNASTETEKTLVNIWSQLLKIPVENISVTDSFFELGGHSVKAMMLASRIQKQLNSKVAVSEIFKLQSIREIAKYMTTLSIEKAKQIPVIEKKSEYPLSPAQKRMYLLYELEKNNIAYNMTQVIEMEPLAKERLETVAQQLIERHESLRTVFFMKNGNIFQKVLDTIDFSVTYHKLDAFDTVEINKKVTAFKRPFDLNKGPLFRIECIETPTNSILLVDIHHIISDASSTEILRKDFMALYQETPLTPLRVQYKDYVVWSESEQEKQRKEAQKAYWLQQLGGELPILDLPIDHTRPAIKSFAGDSYVFNIDEADSNALVALSNRYKVSLNTTLTTIFNIFLHKITKAEDIIVGVPINGRKDTELEKIIGLFVNTLAVRSFPTPEKSFEAFLRESSETILAAFDHQEYPFDELVNALNIKRELSRSPIFDVLFNAISIDAGKEDMQSNMELSTETHAKFDLNVAVIKLHKEISFHFDYCSALFTKETIKRFATFIQQIVREVIQAPTIKINDISILDAQEKQKVMAISRGPEAAFENKTTINELFEKQAEKTPNHPALIFGNEKMTYASLNAKANQLAHVLRRKGVAADVPVALLCTRSFELIISVIAILKAGGVYMPIDISLPNERKQQMLENADAKFILTNLDTGLENMSNYDITDVRSEALQKEDASNLPIVNAVEDLLYIIHTSGSTGVPKGVMLEQRNLLNLLLHQTHHTDITFKNVLQFHAISFDVSAQEIFSALLEGGSLILIEERHTKNIFELFEIIEKEQIESIFFPASFLKFVLNTNIYLERLPKCIHHILTAGEHVIVTDNFRNYMRENNVWLHNHCGPSETHSAAYNHMSPTGHVPDIPPIGYPIADTDLYVLNDKKELLPIGVEGDWYISGACVGRGYINDKVKTDSKYMPDPFHKGQTMYNTGDIAKWHPNGMLEIVGRKDFQVKIRGFRVEIGEVESKFLSLPYVTEVAVLERLDEQGINHLVAFVVQNEEKTEKQLRKDIAKKLPEYMVPTHMISLDEIPLNTNGKVDRKVLLQRFDKTTADDTATALSSNEVLKKLWSELLMIDTKEIEEDDNFFEIGGNSMTALSMIAKLKENVGIDIELMTFFEDPTIANLLTYFEKDSEYNSLHLLNSEQQHKVFFFPPRIGYGFAYKPLAQHIDTAAVYAFDFIEAENRIEQYVEKIISVTAGEAIVLAGWSLGGNLAFEVAKAIEAKGISVTDVLIMDALPMLTKIDAIDDILQKDEFHKEIPKYIEKYPELETIKDVVLNKSDVYFRYALTQIHSGTLKSTIQFLKAENTSQEAIEGWNSLTLQEIQTHHLQGTHQELFLPNTEALRHNSATLKSMLHAIFNN